MESVKPSKIILFIVLFARSGKRSIKDLCAILLMKIFQKFFFAGCDANTLYSTQFYQRFNRFVPQYIKFKVDDV